MAKPPNGTPGEQITHGRARGSTVQNPATTRYSAWEWSRAWIVQVLTVIFLFPIMALLSGRTLPAWITRKLLRNHQDTTRRDRDVRIPGTPSIPAYMLRWWKIPRNWALNCYYHIVKRSDDDTAHHDHPWWSFSIVLDGGYYEERIAAGGVKSHKWYGPGSMLFRRTGKVAHRLVLKTEHVRARPAARQYAQTMRGEVIERYTIGGFDTAEPAYDRELPVKTIFITGPVLRRWGFHHTDSWVDAYEWDEYCQARGLAGHKMAGYAAQLKKDQ